MDGPLNDVTRTCDGGQNDVYETTIDERTPSEAVVDAVAAIRDVEPTELPPLFDTIDPEALDSLGASVDPASTPTVFFEYAGLDVTVEGTDRVVVME